MVVKLQQEISDLKAQLHTATTSPAASLPQASHTETNLSVSLSPHPHASHSHAEEIQEVEEIQDNLQPATNSPAPFTGRGAGGGALNPQLSTLNAHPSTPNLEETQRETILRVLAQCNGNRKLAAEKLGISERTLYRKIKEYNL